uniref:Uncharacterized protein n=1 Tax=Tatumella citrea TaxID=53336 RepID=Q9X5W9_TATCI|nr:unknown [Tatumella citrea]
MPSSGSSIGFSYDIFNIFSCKSSSSINFSSTLKHRSMQIFLRADFLLYLLLFRNQYILLFYYSYGYFSICVII